MSSNSLMTELLQFIANNGFAIVVAAFLLLRTEKKIDDLTAAIKDLIVQSHK